MLPIKHKSIFKSRWIALLWAGGILYSACEFVGSQSATPQGGGDNASTADVQATAKALGLS